MTQAVLLGDIVRVRRGSSPRPIQDYIQNTPGIPWVKIADATSVNSRFITQTKEYIKEDGRKNSVSVTPETLIMSNSATPGLPMIMKIDASVHDGWLILDELKGVDRNWLYYYLLNRRAQSAREASGSVFSNLKTDIVRNFKIDLPDMETQQKVAEMLWTLDEKIELNRRMNETLEQMGQALFRYYFIDNPDAEKWEAGQLDHLFEVTMGQSPPGSSYNDHGEGITFYQGRAEFGVRFPNKRLSTVDPKRLAKKGDTLLSVRAPVGDINQATEDCCVGRGLAAISSKAGQTSFCYYLCKNLQARFAEYNSEGTVFGAINGKQLKSLKVKLPAANAIGEFEDQASKIDEQIFNNAQQIQSLTTLRDTLLPRLINRKVKV